MRIGEFGKQLEGYLKNGQISLEADRAPSKINHYRINNFDQIYRAVDFIDSQEWLSNYIDPKLKQIFSNFSITKKHIDVNSADYTTIRTAIANLNEKLVITTGLIRDFSPHQSEQTINIKLPSSIKSLEDLQSFNQRLEHIFKIFNITGDFELTGFDRGSEWYEIFVNTHPLFKYFVATLGAAYTLVKIRKDFYESELAKAHAELLKKRDIKLSEDEIATEMTAIKAEKEANGIVGTLGTANGKNEHEMIAMVLKATTELVKEMEKGTEFHLSLNPPKYISEESDGTILKIDYTSIPPISEDEKKQKTLEANSPKSKK